MTFSSHPFHEKAMTVFGGRSSESNVCYCRATQLSFLRLISTPAVQKHYGAHGLTNSDALKIIACHLTLPFVRVLEEPQGVEQWWRKLAALNTPSPKVWMDAYLAAFAIAGQLRFVTTDKDFKQFGKHGLHLELVAQ